MAKNQPEPEKLIFATGNSHKLLEVRRILGNSFHLLGLEDLGVTEEIPETGATFRENALQKARFLFTNYGYPCFAEDSGLEVDALQGNPGVRSARYAGERKDDAANVRKVLDDMKIHQNRQARFKSVIAYVDETGQWFFEGKVEGYILETTTGLGGFGYDPVFRPAGSRRSFAQMSTEEKNAISHRGKALNEFIRFLKEHWH